MRKIIILLILIIPLSIQAQGKEKKYHFKKEKISVNQDIIKHYQEWFDDIIDVNGETILEVPYEKEIVPGAKQYEINGTIIFYEVTIIGGGKKITIFNTTCKYIEFDFTNKTIKHIVSNDKNSIMKPKDLKESLEKHEGINN